MSCVRCVTESVIVPSRSQATDLLRFPASVSGRHDNTTTNTARLQSLILNIELFKAHQYAGSECFSMQALLAALVISQQNCFLVSIFRNLRGDTPSTRDQSDKIPIRLI